MTRLSVDLVGQLRQAISVDRLLQSAVSLIEIPSPTGSGAAVADCLASMLAQDGFAVERPIAGWPQAPAVAACHHGKRAGRTIQFNGHLDTVHLPFVAPRVCDGVLTGSGASDMKGGVAAACEALRALRDLGLPASGRVLLTAHDLHELPWGDGRQVDGLIDAGIVGDGVLLPEYLHDRVPLAGRGGAVLEVVIRRDGVPVHEVLGGMEQPSVIHAGAKLVSRLEDLDRRLALQTHPIAGRASVFVGSVHAGEIFNQSPTEFRLWGSRRWLPATSIPAIEAEYRALLAEIAVESKTQVDGRFLVTRDAFEMRESEPFVAAFQAAHTAAVGHPLPIGAKPFVDDGNTFAARGRIPAITHGPNATGAHTTHEAVPVAELARVALVYALTAIAFCDGEVS